MKLVDYETNETLGDATVEQIEAAKNVRQAEGIFSIDEDGRVVENGRRVYVED